MKRRRTKHTGDIGDNNMSPIEDKFRTSLGKLPEPYRWTLHNLVGHPVSEMLHLVGCEELSLTVHRITIPLVETSYRK